MLSEKAEDIGQSFMEGIIIGRYDCTIVFKAKVVCLVQFHVVSHSKNDNGMLVKSCKHMFLSSRFGGNTIGTCSMNSTVCRAARHTHTHTHNPRWGRPTLSLSLWAPTCPGAKPEAGSPPPPPAPVATAALPARVRSLKVEVVQEAGAQWE